MFDHLIGNSSVKQAIRRFIATGRIPNSLLFAGPEGVGKKQFALELARSIVCRGPREGEACGECASCKRVGVFEFPGADAKGDDYDRVFFSEHSDVGMVVPFNRTLRVGSIRALEAEANFRPYEAPARVFIIDDAQKMNEAASNALLKTLEEPPVTTHIFLVSSKPDSLLPTIRSRSQILRFGPVDASEIEHLLLMSHKYSQEDARLIASNASGNVAWASSVKVDEYRARREIAIDILRSAILDHDIVSLLKKAESVNDAKNKDSYEEFLDILQALIHEVWACRAGGVDSGDTTINELAEAADPRALAAWLKNIEELRENFIVNINRKIATDALFVQMAGH
jgi:DNA polymerase-3 subunit delta'